MKHLMNSFYEGYFIQYNKHIQMRIWVAWTLRKQINQSQDYISKIISLKQETEHLKYENIILTEMRKKRSEDNCFLPRIRAVSVNKMTLNKPTTTNRKLNQNMLQLQKKILNIAPLLASRNNYHQLGRGNKYLFSTPSNCICKLFMSISYLKNCNWW